MEAGARKSEFISSSKEEALGPCLPHQHARVTREGRPPHASTPWQLLQVSTACPQSSLIPRWRNASISSRPFPSRGLLLGNRGSACALLLSGSWGEELDSKQGRLWPQPSRVRKKGEVRVRSGACRLRESTEARFARMHCACAVLGAAEMAGTPASSWSPQHAASRCALPGPLRAWQTG